MPKQCVKNSVQPMIQLLGNSCLAAISCNDCLLIVDCCGGVLVNLGLWAFIYTHLSLGPPPPHTHISTAERSGVSLDQCNAFIFFFFQTFCCRFAAVFGIIVLLHDPVWAKLQLSDRCAHI